MHKVLVVGNGFYLSAGMKTSYKDFLSSEFYTRHKDAYLFNFLSKASITNDWFDVELFLKNYALALSGNISKVPRIFVGAFEKLSDPAIFNFAKKYFLSEYRSLKEALKLYLEAEESRGVLEFSTGSDSYFKKTHIENKFHSILNFNYTRAALDKTFCKVEESPDILHLHGSLMTDDIVFGVDDGFADISDEFLFLKKSSHASYGSFPSLKLVALNAREMHFYGLSFGVTDDSHFLPLFKFLSSENAQISIEEKSYQGVTSDWGVGDLSLIRNWNR